MESDSRPSKRRRVSNPDLDPKPERRESPSPTRTRKSRKNNIPATDPESTVNTGTEEVAEKKDDEAPSQSTRRSARIRVTGNSVVSTSAGPPRPRVVEEEDTQNSKRSRKTKTSIAGSSSTKKLARKSSKPTAATTTTTTTTTTGRKNKKENKKDERDGRLKGKKEKKGVSGTDDVWEVPCDRENEDEDELAIAQLVANDAAIQLQTELGERIEVPPETVNQPAYAERFISLCEEHGLEPMLAPLGEFILEKLNGKRLIPLKGLDNEYRTVFQLLEQTVVAGEGNSLLLLGARGSGKTAVVNTALAALSKTNADDFHVVRLNGFLHTDDKVALREIWQQLGREIDPQEDLEKPSSYADTMASLLALLSHPEEITGPLPEENGMTTTKSVVIVLDEFDLFSYHPRQTLLYNLFDIAQAKKAPVAVLGLTTKVEVTENLEKRVKSRFSHRHVFLPRPRSFVEFVDICMASLKVEGDEVDSCPLDGEKGPILLKGWNDYIQDLFEDAEFARHLEPIYYQSKSVRDFFRSALVPITSMALGSVAGTKAELPGTQSFASNSLACPDPAPLPFTQLSGSSSNVSLPLSLLLTATRLTALHESTATAASLSLSFAAVYSEYVRLLTVAKASASASGAAATPGRVWGKEAAKEAWEKLVEWGLVLPVNGYGMGDGKMFRVEVSFEEAVAALGSTGAGALGRWWRDG